MIRSAIIMAGGMGKRISGIVPDRPKGFIEIDNMSLIERSINKLIAAGIENIIIGTGYLNSYYEKLTSTYSNITTVYNDKYEVTSSMETLARCIPLVTHDAILLESDLLYDSIGLHVLLNDYHPNIILASGMTHSSDEVYLEVDHDKFITNISKTASDLNNIYGELTGISKLTKNFMNSMLGLYNTNPELYGKKDYEHVIRDVSNCANMQDKVYILKKEYFLWCEIDCEQHLERALSIYPRIKESEEVRSIKRQVLLNPGPATTTDSVKFAQSCPDICPRENEFGDLMEWISSELSDMAGGRDKIETVLFGGSGTAADEVMISSCIPKTAKLLVIDNGAYGERLAKIASVYNFNFDVYKSSSSSLLDIDEIKKQLIDYKYTHLAMVYHETTTGLLNPAPEICRFCKEHGIVTMIDAVSAFAAIDIDMIRDGFDFMTSTSNKNIQGMAGVGMVFCNKKALDSLSNIPMNNYYLNLYDQYQYFKKTHQMRFTPPVQILYALRQAIIETKIETIDGRYNRYSKCWKILIDAVDALGLKVLVPIEYQSKLITAIIEPDNTKYNFNDFHDRALLQGFTIYPGKLSNANTFRIANIGDIKPDEMGRFVEFMKEYFNQL